MAVQKGVLNPGHVKDTLADKGRGFPKFKAAAVQASPVFLDREATTAKVCDLIDEAGTNGAKLIAFPEVFIPGYPFWNWIDTPLNATPYFRALVNNAVEVPSETTENIGAAARRNHAYVVVSVNERGRHSMAEVYNTALIFSPEGTIIRHHRKLVPTFAEKLTWSSGDGSSLFVNETEIGRLGVLNCGENGNSLLRYALIAQGEQVHVANYPGLSLRRNHGMYDMRRGIETRSAAHAFEGKLFNIVSCSILTNEMLDVLCDTNEKRRLFDGNCNVYTAIFGPEGLPIGGPLDPDVEGIVYAEIDLAEILPQKLFHDIAGNYNRFDVVSLNLNSRHNQPIHESVASESRQVASASRSGNDYDGSALTPVQGDAESRNLPEMDARALVQHERKSEILK